MVAPNPQLRISPSGNEATGETSPFTEYAGYAFQAVRSSQVGNELLEEYTEAGGSADDPITFVVPTGTQPASAPARGEDLVAVGTKSENMLLTEGEWLFDIQVAHGFGVVGPTFTFGGIELTLTLLGDDGNAVGAPISGSLMSVSWGAQANARGDGVKSAKWKLNANISSDMIAANGGSPIKGFTLAAARVTSTKAVIGAYDSNSDNLFIITQGTNVIARKVS